MALAADCCAAQSKLNRHRPTTSQRDSNSDSNSHDDDDHDDGESDDYIEHDHGIHKPLPLGDALVERILDAIKALLEPIPEDYVLPAKTLLDQVSRRNVPIPRAQALRANTDLLDVRLAELDTYVKVVVEYVTASSWQSAFKYFKDAVYSIRTSMATIGGPDISKAALEAEGAALVVVRLLSFFWVDGPKLRLLIQEICSSYLHFRKPYQNAVAVVIPLLITRWIDRFPRQFVQLHLLRKRLDVAADTLFDMAQRVSDNAKRKAMLFPLQITLLFLLPDVFEVASNLKEAKSSGIVKKVSFLEGLRKTLKNGQEPAAYCLVSLLRVARHFDAESDSALVSYAMDVQDEVRDAVFRRSLASSSTVSPSPTTGSVVSTFDQDTMTATFVSLVHLNLDGSVSTLVSTCISPSAPASFKIATIQGCCYFATQPYALQYHELFDQVLPFMQSQLEVRFGSVD